MNESERIKLARYFAINAHAGQKYDNDPYFSHLENTYNVLLEYDINDEILLVSAFLHDAIEDTTTSYNDIKKAFGIEVAELVFAVTDELGRNRKEKHEKTYPKLQKFPAAIILKLADRIANLKHAISSQNGNMLWMYKKEYSDFRTYLKPYGGLDKMWDYLDTLFEYKP